MWDSVGNWGTDNSAVVKNPYLIPDDANVVMHVNAIDLHGSTAKVGPVWTINGTVPFVAAGGAAPFRPGVGPYSAANNFSLADGNVLQFTGAQVWSACLIYLRNGTADDIPFCSCGTNTTGGWIMINQSVVDAAGANFPANLYAQSPGAPAGGVMNVLQIGWDGTNICCKLNGTTYATVASANAAAASQPAYIGTGITLATGVYPMNGLVYEAYASKTAASSALFTSIYNSILANL